MQIDLVCPSCGCCLKTAESDAFMPHIGKTTRCKRCDSKVEIKKLNFRKHLTPEKRKKAIEMKAKAKAMMAAEKVAPPKPALSKKIKAIQPPDTKKCPYCAEEILVEAIKCKHCGEMLEQLGKELDPPKRKPPKKRIIRKTYKGNFKQATAKFEEESEKMAREGYVVSSNTYVEGKWGCGSFLVALALCMMVIGIFVFIYMIIVKPQGEMVVTYRWEEQ